MNTRDVVMRFVQRALTISVAGAVLTACQDAALPTAAPALDGGALFTNSTDEVTQSAVINAINAGLSSAGSAYQVLSAEISVAIDSAGWEGATTIIANNHTHLLSSQFVSNDPRRGSPLNTITYLVDQSDGSALSFNPTPPPTVITLPNTVTEPAIDAAMQAWTTGPSCNPPAVAKVTDTGADPDVVDFFLTGNPALLGTPFADVTHAGFLPGSFFNLIAPSGGTFILGVTFTFIFVNGGVPTDIDGDGRTDVAFREIYYNRAFPWTTNATENNNVDIQTVATHEAGHAFGLGHFGKVFRDNDGTIKYAPKAMLNAVYVSADRALYGTDNGSFCHIWANNP